MKSRKEIIKKMEHFEGNYTRSCGDIFITPENMKNFVNFTKLCDSDDEAFLFTPYLINTEGDEGVCEIYEYEFSLSFENVAESHCEGNVDGNRIFVETLDCFAPKAIIAKGDFGFFVQVIESYLGIMNKREFERFRNAYEGFKTAGLYYQIF